MRVHFLLPELWRDKCSFENGPVTPSLRSMKGCLMNRKGLGRIIALLISVAMISSGLSGCDGERPGLPPPGEEEETPKLTGP